MELTVTYRVVYRGFRDKFIKQNFRTLEAAEKFANMLVSHVRMIEVTFQTENVRQHGTLYVYSRFNTRRVQNADLLAKVLARGGR